MNIGGGVITWVGSKYSGFIRYVTTSDVWIRGVQSFKNLINVSMVCS